MQKLIVSLARPMEGCNVISVRVFVSTLLGCSWCLRLEVQSGSADSAIVGSNLISKISTKKLAGRLKAETQFEFVSAVAELVAR